MTTTPTYPGNPTRVHANQQAREATIRGLAALAGWLRDHPEAPVNRWGHGIIFSPADGADGVKRIAAALGVDAVDAASVVTATVRFGPVRYVVYAAKTGESS